MFEIWIKASTILFFVTLVYARSDPSASVTINQLPDYDFQRECGKGCIQNNYNAGDDIMKRLGCTWNGCYCGHAAEATSIVVSCWSAYCGGTVSRNSPDVSTALSLYNAYCDIDATTTPALSTYSTSPPPTTNNMVITSAIQTASQSGTTLNTGTWDTNGWYDLTLY